MNKTLWIIVAVLLIICGAILFALAGMQMGWDFTKLDSKNFETNTYEFSESIDSIKIETVSGQIRLLPTSDGVCRVECWENEKMKHLVSVADGALTVSCKDDRKWFDHITFFNFKSPSITVYLPESEYAALTVKGSTGDVFVSEDLTFGEANINITTGDVLFRADVKGELGIKLTTGDIELENMSAGSVYLNAATGDAEVSNLNCETFECDVSTGETELTNLIAREHIRIECTTGDVTLTSCDAGELYIKTTTGDVEASLLSEKVCIAKATTGSVNVPSFGSGGVCEIKTTSGDIKVNIK